MNEKGLEEDGKKSAMSDDDEIEHTLGPQVRKTYTHPHWLPCVHCMLY